MKDVQKINNGATDPIRNVLAGSLRQVVVDRQITLFMARLLPLITDVDGIEVTTENVFFNRGYFEGKAQITDSRPDSVPTVAIDSKRESVPMKWISIGLAITRQDRDLYAQGITKFENKSLAAMRVMAEKEEEFLRTGVIELSLGGFETVAGINIVTAVAKWETLTGAQILEEIREYWSAHTMNGKFAAKSFWLDKQLHDLLYKPFSDKEPKSTLEVLVGRKWFQNIVSIPNYNAATIVEDEPSNFGYIIDVPPKITEKYMDKTTEVHMLEEHLSSVMILQPQSITKIEGAL